MGLMVTVSVWHALRTLAKSLPNPGSLPCSGVRLSGKVSGAPVSLQCAPLSVQEVVQVVVMPRSQAMQAATHCFMSLGLYGV